MSWYADVLGHAWWVGDGLWICHHACWPSHAHEYHSRDVMVNDHAVVHAHIGTDTLINVSVHY